MGKKKQPQIYFSSDFHLGHHSEWTGPNGETLHRGIIDFERTQFSSIREHDEFIIALINDWCFSWPEGSTLYYLGDFGDIEYLWLFDFLRNHGHKVVFVCGNHDHNDNHALIAEHVDEFYKYPIYISDKLVVSHQPVAVWPGVINIHGHLHGMVMDSPNYICASLHVANYKPITMQQVQSHFSKLPKHTMRFLYEPFADMLKLTQPKDDVIATPNGNIDVSASRMLQKINTDKRIANGEPYRPYSGNFKK